MTILSCVADQPLIDHHCHGLTRTNLDRTAFEELLTEANTVSPLGTTLFDSTIGLAVRRWCAPILDLPPHTPAEDYLARRTELGATEVNRRMIATTGSTDLLVDSGFRPELLTTPDELAALTGIRTHEIVRLETLAESVIHDDGDFAENCASALAKQDAIGCKSIAAYRVGLRLTGTRPTDAEVRKAADHWRQSSTTRLANETLHRYLIWLAIDNGLPVQFHVGYGDADLNLHECDPLLLTDLLRATQHTGVPIMLLHNYPFHRSSGYLAQVFPHVFVDVGLATHHAGFRGPGLIAELLEITPFGKVLYSSDAFGLAEHYMLGALLFRRGLSDFLKAGITQDALTPQDAERVAGLVSRHNAQRVYQRTSE